MVASVIHFLNFPFKLNRFCELTLDDEKSIRMDKSSIAVKNGTKLVHVEEITPNVVEPSFGIGRILYALLEHSFRKRDGDSNSYFALPASIAAHKCSILPLSNRSEFQPYIEKIRKINFMANSFGCFNKNEFFSSCFR